MDETEVFEKFDETFKLYEDGVEFKDLDGKNLFFDAKILELENLYDSDVMLSEMNKVSRLQFRYGAIHESQNRIVQQLEDEYNMWFSEKYVNLPPNAEKTEKAKERRIMTEYSDEYTEFMDKIRNEKYKLGMVSRINKSIDNYSIKLHAILKYRKDGDSF